MYEAEILPFLNLISDRNWTKFCELEREYVSQHGAEQWQELFNFHIKPQVDRDSDRWLLLNWCGGGVVDMERVG